MGNTFVRVTRPLRSLLAMPSLHRAQNYTADDKDVLRHHDSSTGFRVEEHCKHAALVHTRTLKKACCFSAHLSEKNDVVCEIKMIRTAPEMMDCLIASDDEHKLVAAIAAVVSNFAAEASLDTIKVNFMLCPHILIVSSQIEKQDLASQCCKLDELQVLHILQNWICKGLLRPSGHNAHSTCVQISKQNFVHPAIHSIDQTKIYQVISALQNIGSQSPKFKSLAWVAYVNAITSEAIQHENQSHFNVVIFSIMQFLDQYLGDDTQDLDISQERTYEATFKMLMRQIKNQTHNSHSDKYVHLCALLAACSLKKQDVVAATFFADEASRIMKQSWHSLLLKRTITREPMEVADYVVICQCALLKADFVTARGICAKILQTGSGRSYFYHSILHHGHVLNALINLLHGTVRSSSYHLECAREYGARGGLDAPTLVPEIRCRQEVDSHYNLAVATFHFLTGMWPASSMHLKMERSNDILADSMEAVLYMFAFQKAPRKCKRLSSDINAKCTISENETQSGVDSEDLEDNQHVNYSLVDSEEIWNKSMENASDQDQMSKHFLAITKLSADLQIPCIHSPICFAFSLRLLLDKKAAEALDICEYWLEDLGKTRHIKPECFMWYRIGYSACRALAFAILSQSMKTRDSLVETQKDLIVYDLPGLRAYVSCIGLWATGELTSKRLSTANNFQGDTNSIWKNPNIWKRNAVFHVSSCKSSLNQDLTLQKTNHTHEAPKIASKPYKETSSKRRNSNVFEDYEVLERQTFLSNQDLALLIIDQHASLDAALKRMRMYGSVENLERERECIFEDLWKHMNSWKMELDEVMISASDQMQQL